MLYPSEIEIVPTPGRDAVVRVPGSKSITNRALVLAALAGNGCTITDALESDDTRVMVDCLRRLGFDVDTDWPTVRVGRNGSGRVIPANQAELFVGNSGTTVRFLTAMLALGQGTYRLDGVPRMRERPIEDLLTAVRQLGVTADSDRGTGCPPVTLTASGIAGDRVSVRADVSSQFLSALLMAAPAAGRELTIAVDGAVVSEPYIDMTLRMLDQWGATVRRDGSAYVVSPGFRPPSSYAVEPDASAASYFLAAGAILGRRITVAGLGGESLQGDTAFADLLGRMGCTVERSDAGLTVVGGRLKGIDADMNAISDTVMTLAAVACFADGPTRITNVAHIRHKETDRLAAVATELRRFGVTVEERADGLTIIPGPMHGAAVETYDDHRMAMSLALVGLKVPGVKVKDPGCVAKTYPGFWADLACLSEPEA